MKATKDNGDVLMCPLCKGEMAAIFDYGDTGVTVVCLNPCLSTCHENVSGHGRNMVQAYEVACQKYNLNRGN